MDDELVAAQVIEHLDLDRVRSQRRQAVLVRFARGLGVFECRHPFISTVSLRFRFQLRSRSMEVISKRSVGPDYRGRRSARVTKTYVDR